MRAEHAEREVAHEPCGFREQSSAPPRGMQDEAQLDAEAARMKRSELKHPRHFALTPRHDSETDVLTPRALHGRPLDKVLDSLNRPRRRPGVTGNFGQ